MKGVDVMSNSWFAKSTNSCLDQPSWIGIDNFQYSPRWFLGQTNETTSIWFDSLCGKWYRQIKENLSFESLESDPSDSKTEI